MLKYLLFISYMFLLGVLLPHTAWMFSLFEASETTGLGWAAAIAFEITIAVLTYYLALRIAAVSLADDEEKFGTRLKHELFNIPGLLLLGSVMISVVANWTHASEFANGLELFEQSVIIRIAYSFLFGAILPVCSFAYAYVLSQVYSKSIDGELSNSEDNKNVITEEEEAWLVVTKHLRTGGGKRLTPDELAELANIPLSVAAKVLTDAINLNMYDKEN